MDENLLDVEQNTEIDTDGGQPVAPDVETGVGIEFTVENPLPVKVIEEPEIFDGEVFAAEGSDFGTISSQYLDYFTGIVEKLPYNTHYVIWKSGDYSYSMAYGKDMELTGGLISGYDVNCVRAYRESGSNSDWKTKTEKLGNLELRTEQLFAYSDMGNLPTVERGLSTLEAMALLFGVGFAVVYSVCRGFFDYILKYVYRK